ncbi:MAG: hypothetical protein K6F37_05420 [Lachnospiraceae bacterium]|nr:hypothetical protein [Lachnospiraceae bacterium]
MKKRYLLILALGCVCLAAAGCDMPGASKDAGTTVESEAASENDDTEVEGDASESTIINTAGIDGFDSAVKTYFSDVMTLQNEEGSEYSKEYALIYKNDTDASYIEAFKYADGSKYYYQYEGTCTVLDNGNIGFTSNTVNDTDVASNFIITLDGEKISDVQYTDSFDAQTDIIGEYTGTSEEYGDVTLKVEEGANTTLVLADGTEYTGYITNYNGDWDFMSNNDDNGEPGIDWIIEFDGNTFTYHTYNNHVYGAYEGSYDLTGELGEFTVNCDSEGHATADIVINGETRSFTGYPDYDYDTKAISGFYLNDDWGYSVTLYFGLAGDDSKYQYTGSYTIPMN